MTAIPPRAITAAASAIADAVFEAWGGALAGDGAQRLAGAALDAAAPHLAAAQREADAQLADLHATLWDADGSAGGDIRAGVLREFAARLRDQHQPAPKGRPDDRTSA